MNIAILDDRLWFPPADRTTADGLLAMGGDLSPERLVLAYRSGIFPWYDGDIPLWWCPDPRFVLFPPELYISKSMQVLLRRNAFTFTLNQAFDQVVHACRSVTREGQDGTWINDDVEASYGELHRQGIAISAEAWQDGELAGGLYGIRMGNVFFGESMFSRQSNASKFAFIRLATLLQEQGVQLIDCQVYTTHLESLGARMIPRTTFLDILAREIT